MTVPPTPDGTPGAPEPQLPPWAKGPVRRDELADERMALVVGPRWEKTYRRKLAPFFEDPTFVPTWNWAAALATPVWFLYRKLYLAFALFFFTPAFALRWLTGSDTQLTMETLMAPENQSLRLMNLAVFLSSHIAAGGTANWLLFRRARAVSRLVALQQAPEAETRELLRRYGGVNRTAMILFLALSFMIAVAATQA